MRLSVSGHFVVNKTISIDCDVKSLHVQLTLVDCCSSITSPQMHRGHHTSNGSEYAGSLMLARSSR